MILQQTIGISVSCCKDMFGVKSQEVLVVPRLPKNIFAVVATKSISAIKLTCGDLSGLQPGHPQWPGLFDQAPSVF